MPPRPQEGGRIASAAAAIAGGGWGQWGGDRGLAFCFFFFFSSPPSAGFSLSFSPPGCVVRLSLRRAGPGLWGVEGKREEVGPAWRGGATGIASGVAYSASGSATGF